jgi:anti-sigma factor RsiW
MICPLKTEETELLLDYSAGRLNAPKDAARKAFLEQHIVNCRECASFQTDQAAVWNALDLWEPAPVSVDFNRKLWGRIDTAAAAPWYRRLAASLQVANLKPVLPMTAAIALIAAGFLLDHPGSNKAQAGFTVNEAEQVEQTLDDIQLLHQMDAVAATPDANSQKM